MPNQPDQGRVEFALGKVEEGLRYQQREIDRVNAKLDDLPRLIKEAVIPLTNRMDGVDKRLDGIDSRVSTLTDTIVKWKAIFGVVALISAGVGYAASGLTSLKTIYGFFGK